MLAIRPQNSAGSVEMMFGPGVTPCRISAPTIIAMVALAGMPSVRSGMKLVCAPALLALSGAATPSMAPLPKRSGVLDTRFSSR